MEYEPGCDELADARAAEVFDPDVPVTLFHRWHVHHVDGGETTGTRDAKQSCDDVPEVLPELFI